MWDAGRCASCKAAAAAAAIVAGVTAAAVHIEAKTCSARLGMGSGNSHANGLVCT